MESIAEQDKMRRVSIKDVTMDSLRALLSTAASDRERRVLNRLLERRRRTLRRRHHAAWPRSKFARCSWQTDFCHGLPAVLLRQVNANMFESSDMQLRAPHHATTQEWVDS